MASLVPILLEKNLPVSDADLAAGADYAFRTMQHHVTSPRSPRLHPEKVHRSAKQALLVLKTAEKRRIRHGLQPSTLGRLRASLDSVERLLQAYGLFVWLD
jgi:hypothetical protein